jgi:hypothetical protein
MSVLDLEKGQTYTFKFSGSKREVIKIGYDSYVIHDIQGSEQVADVTEDELILLQSGDLKLTDLIWC